MNLVFRFGKNFKKGFIQEANRRSRMKGTTGSFNKWCNAQGLAKDGKVTLKCINRAKRSNNVTLRRRANFAKNIKAFAGAKRSRFGKAKTSKKSKYTAKAGRKSPGVSATLFPVGTVKKGLDKNMWVIVQTSKGVKRWKKMRSSKFGQTNEETLETLEKFEQEKEKIVTKLEKEIEIAEKIIINYPENNSLRKKSIRLFQNANYYLNLLTKDNIKNFINDFKDIIICFTGLLTAFIIMANQYDYFEKSTNRFAKGLYSLFGKKNNVYPGPRFTPQAPVWGPTGIRRIFTRVPGPFALGKRGRSNSLNGELPHAKRK